MDRLFDSMITEPLPQREERIICTNSSTIPHLQIRRAATVHLECIQLSNKSKLRGKDGGLL